MKILNSKIIRNYTLTGIIFGLLFPLSANIFEIIYGKYHLDISTLLLIRRENPILIMIDTAPFFLGIAAYIAGLNQFRACSTQSKYKKLATYDELTGLYNRRVGKLKLEKLIKNCSKEDHISIFYIDLDNFKLINDTLGHSAGDKVLQNVAKKLEQFANSNGYAMRIGGDEFIVVLKETIEYDNLEDLALLLANHITTPIIINKNMIKLKGSIGIASFPHDALTLEDLMFSANVAMFDAKKENMSYSFYNDKFKENYKRKLFIKSNILSSLEENHFYMVYQPIIDAKTLHISGVEALIRWNHPEKGSFSPSEFIPIAENNDSILKIGRWILEKVCTDMERWKKEGLGDLFVSINISPNQINSDNFSKEVQNTINKYKIDSSKIKFEITESVAITNFYDTNKIMNSFNHLNVEWFIDDFGSGYTSLSMIKHLSIDCLKIDKSFVCDLNICESSSQIVTAMHSLSSALGMKIISEGVETKDQLEVLRMVESDYLQGYLFSHPLEYDELIEKYRLGGFTPFHI